MRLLSEWGVSRQLVSVWALAVEYLGTAVAHRRRPFLPEPAAGCLGTSPTACTYRAEGCRAVGLLLAEKMINSLVIPMGSNWASPREASR